MIILSNGFYFVNFLYLIQILAIGAIGVYFILKDNYQNIEIIVPISLFVIAAKGIIASFIYSSFSLLSFLEAGCYAALGFIIIDNLNITDMVEFDDNRYKELFIKSSLLELLLSKI